MRFLIAFIFGLFATCLSDLTFWRTLIKHKTIWASEEHNGVKNSLTERDFLISQLILLVLTFGMPFLLITDLPNRFSVFSPFTLVAVIFLFLFKELEITHTYETPNFKPWIIIFILYIILFIQDFYMFNKVNSEENFLSNEKASEIISDTSLEISGKDLLKISSSVDGGYYSNGRILLCSSAGILVLYENSVEFIECSFLKNNWVPDEICAKNAVQLGVFVDNENRPYIVYALMKKTSLLGSYKIEQYALYNLVEEKIDAYCTELPNWAKY